jgi:hypothetical protein
VAKVVSNAGYVARLVICVDQFAWGKIIYLIVRQRVANNVYVGLSGSLRVW